MFYFRSICVTSCPAICNSYGPAQLHHFQRAFRPVVLPAHDQVTFAHLVAVSQEIAAFVFKFNPYPLPCVLVYPPQGLAIGESRVYANHHKAQSLRHRAKQVNHSHFIHRPMGHRACMHHRPVHGPVRQQPGAVRPRLRLALFLLVRCDHCQHVPPLRRPAMLIREVFKTLWHVFPTSVADPQGHLATLAEMPVFRDAGEPLQLSCDPGPVTKQIFHTHFPARASVLQTALMQGPDVFAKIPLDCATSQTGDSRQFAHVGCVPQLPGALPDCRHHFFFCHCSCSKGPVRAPFLLVNGQKKPPGGWLLILILPSCHGRRRAEKPPPANLEKLL